MNKFSFDHILGAIGLISLATAMASTVFPLMPNVGDFGAVGVILVGLISSKVPLVEEIGNSGEIFA